jgi:hypothetical protein
MTIRDPAKLPRGPAARLLALLLAVWAKIAAQG